MPFIKSTVLKPQLSARALLCLVITHAAIAGAKPNSLADLSLEQLAQLPVVSVTRGATPVAEAPASIFVITQRDIRRSGATTLPESLRLAPNLQVARQDTRNYGITARGFNNRLANKMLVMVDGRIVYSPLFAGVFWGEQDVFLEDLARVEVVSGPGGTLWGANAVNGVINVVSRSAEDTQGELVSVGAGTHQRQIAARYGGALADTGGHYRVYAKHSQHDDTQRADGDPSETDWQRGLVGFRADWKEVNSTDYTLQGAAYGGTLNQYEREDAEYQGGHLLARAEQRLSDRSLVSIQTYLDHLERDMPGSHEQRLTTWDIELQHQWQANATQHLIWGGGYRFAADNLRSETIAFIPPEREMHWVNLFAQSAIELTEQWRLTLGSKFENNPFSGWEALPSAQLAWSTDNGGLLWSSLSRAVRSPSRFNRDFYTPANPPVEDGVPQYSVSGNPHFKAEVARVAELGWRSRFGSAASYSLTGFYSHYDRLRTLEPIPDGPGIEFQNQGEATTYGVEFWGSWQPAPVWRLHAGLVVQEFDFSTKPGSQDQSQSTALAARDPSYYGQLRSSHNLGSGRELDFILRRVDRLEIDDSEVPAYTELDVQFAVPISEHLQLSVVGQNLINRHHVEFGSEPSRSVYERMLFAKLVWGL